MGFYDPEVNSAVRPQIRRFVRRRLLTGAAALCLVLALAAAVSFPASLAASSVERQLPIYCVQRDQKMLAISFDAAWGADNTDQIAEILNRYNVKTTFFVVGKWAESYPDKVKELSDAGHEVMNHSYSHPYFSQCSTEEICRELSDCNDTISSITGQTPTLVRCPYGDYDDHSIQTIREQGMEPIQWSVDSLDWKELSAEEITRRVLDGVTNGSIVLFHNAGLHTPEALPEILEALISEGYTIVPVSQLLLGGNTVIDSAGMQLPAE